MTDPKPNISRKNMIYNGVWRAVALAGGPVGYKDIQKHLRELEPESLNRYLRANQDQRIIKMQNGQYTVNKLFRMSALGRFM
jgi:hypothetical protein